MKRKVGSLEGDLIHKVLKTYNIKRQVFHSGDFNGVCIRRLMDKAKVIFDKLTPLLIEYFKGLLTDTDIKKISNDHSDLMISLGEAFRLLRKIDPKEEDFNNCQNHVQSAMAKWRELNLSITPKVHLFEDHAVEQMRNFPRGLGHKTEDFVERNHQDGIRLDRRLHGLADYEDRTKAALSYEEMSLKAPVQQHIKKVKIETSYSQQQYIEGEFDEL